MFTFKGIDSTIYLKELKVGHSVLPPSQIKTLEIEGRSGAYFIKKTHGIRTISIDVAIIQNTQSDFRTRVRNIADWLDSEEPQTLVFSDEPDKSYQAVLSDSTDLEQILAIGTGTLTFICPDPFAEGASKSHSLVAGSNTVTYNGTAKVFPKYTVTFGTAQTSFEISNGTDKVRIVADLATTSTLVIDSKTGKVTINGVNNLQTMTLDSDFFPLVKGSNTLTVSTGASVTVEYKERFK